MLDRIRPPFPSPRLSLLSIPSTLISFERRRRLSPLPVGRWRWLGVPLLAAGVALSVWSWRALRQHGQGPVESPRTLVEAGPYRYVRNPMWVGRVLGLSGAALLLRSWLLLLYVPVHAVWMHLYIVNVEEPQLAERFGEQFEEYRRRVPRWLPLGRRRPAEEV